MWGFVTKIMKGPADTLGVLSVLGVPSQLNMSNLDCLGPGVSIDTHIVRICKKGQNFEFPAKRPMGALGTFGGWDPKPSYQALISGS